MVWAGPVDPTHHRPQHALGHLKGSPDRLVKFTLPSKRNDLKVSVNGVQAEAPKSSGGDWKYEVQIPVTEFPLGRQEVTIIVEADGRREEYKPLPFTIKKHPPAVEFLSCASGQSDKAYARVTYGLFFSTGPSIRCERDLDDPKMNLQGASYLEGATLTFGEQSAVVKDGRFSVPFSVSKIRIANGPPVDRVADLSIHDVPNKLEALCGAKSTGLSMDYHEQKKRCASVPGEAAKPKDNFAAVDRIPFRITKPNGEVESGEVEIKPHPIKPLNLLWNLPYGPDGENMIPGRAPDPAVRILIPPSKEASMSTGVKMVRLGPETATVGQIGWVARTTYLPKREVGTCGPFQTVGCRDCKPVYETVYAQDVKLTLRNIATGESKEHVIAPPKGTQCGSGATSVNGKTERTITVGFERILEEYDSL